MGFEIATNPPLATAQPPFLLLTYQSPNVESWQLETLLFPSMGEFAFTRRMIRSITLMAVNSYATLQAGNNQRIGTYLFLTRDGQQKSTVLPAAFIWTGITTSDEEERPMAYWHEPFAYPARGGDGMTIHVPGDADATPVQDWELYIELGEELPTRRPG